MQELGLVKDYEHVIHLKHDARIVNRCPYHHSPEDEKEIQRQVDALLELGIIRISESPWSAPCLLVTKKSDRAIGSKKKRLVMDYHVLNQELLSENWPLLSVEGVIKMLSANSPTLWSKLDLKNAYWQLKVSESSQSLLTFCTAFGAYTWTRLPFGLLSSGAAFSMIMSKTLAPLGHEFVIAYLDDILITGTRWDTHLSNIDKVLWRLREVGLTLSPEKCDWGREQIEYLGYIFDKNG